MLVCLGAFSPGRGGSEGRISVLHTVCSSGVSVVYRVWRVFEEGGNAAVVLTSLSNLFVILHLILVGRFINFKWVGRFHFDALRSS
jgi:hypothetical protein